MTKTKLKLRMIALVNTIATDNNSVRVAQALKELSALATVMALNLDEFDNPQQAIGRWTS